MGRAPLAFLFAVPIAVLGGLIGLGGAEFRLPVLLGPLRHPARQAVVLNLAISLVTISVSLGVRAGTLSFEPLREVWPAVAGLMAGGVVAAFQGARLVHHLPEAALEKVLSVLLLAIGLLLLAEAFVSRQAGGVVGGEPLVQALVGFTLGLGIGLVSSLLGVAGGELLIPTLVFVFGLGVKPAGTASLLISLPTVTTGVWRHWRRGMYEDRQALKQTVAPMALGSVLGALLGAALVGIVSASLLKFLLGGVLIISALRMARTAWQRS